MLVASVFAGLDLFTKTKINQLAVSSINEEMDYRALKIKEQ